MIEHLIIIAAFFLIFFNISGLATTNILRLTTGNTLPILSAECHCDSCGAKITPLFQLPIISFIICKGRCRHCNAKLPKFALLLEIIVLTGMFIISLTLSFSPAGISLSFLYYEFIRVFVILKQGRRQKEFRKQYITAVLLMVPFYLMSLFVSLLYGIISCCVYTDLLPFQFHNRAPADTE